ncbi:oxidoreductase [Vibrio sp. 10N.286.49.B3]|uniref:ferredoxin reductase family protein n=1 Tax=Vibrio sp. 10N.286.49.B3 TaxID=1880855 RepID=UPI000C84975F|nr:ferric reductase-like transmembrane domain-containing protein [Vibrio sp. 10N.286.49.B3]PMH44563.1 oxidoreductase [Vibrio sp. 10N.286.49.B3]
MKNTYFKFTVFLIVLSLFWLQAEPQLFSLTNFFQYRSAFVQYSGIITVTLMVAVMLLALRLPFIEKFTHGLDKSYHLHKWLGITSLAFAILHWAIAIIPKYLVRWEILSKPEKGVGNINPDSLYSIIRPLRSGAEGVGEWAFYLMLILGVISLLGTIGYKKFKLTHKLMAFCFLIIAYHSAVLLKHSYWPYPITYFTLGIIMIGIFAALWSLSGYVGKKRIQEGHVSSLSHDNKNRVTDLHLSVANWPGHADGQFAYLNFGQNNIHPFTIASTDTDNGQLRFLIKELGDFTSTLKSNLFAGDPVTIEGPYGCFDFNDQKPQIWIAGGIGIAAFKAALQKRPSPTQPVTLYYCTNAPSMTLIHELEQEAQQSNITFKVVDGRTQPFLDVKQLSEQHSDLLQCSIWFCGPTAFSEQLTHDLSSINYDLSSFHQEFFSMR